MRALVIGYGVQGKKREKISGKFSCVGIVDPVDAGADIKMLSDVPVDSYDAAFVCTPDDSKFELLKLLLSQGKHLLVEKPLLLTAEQFDELEILAKAKKAVAYTAFNHRFEPHLVTARDIIRSGKLGEIYSLRMFYGNGTAADVKASIWRDRGAGVLPDLGSHILDLTDFLLEFRPQQLKLIEAFTHENRAPDTVVFGEMNKKPSLLYELTLLSWKNSFYLDVIGSKGSLHVDCLCKWGPSTLSIRTRKLPSGRPEEEISVIEQGDPTWEIESNHFYDLIANGRPTNFNTDRWISASLRSLGGAI